LKYVLTPFLKSLRILTKLRLNIDGSTPLFKIWHLEKKKMFQNSVDQNDDGFYKVHPKKIDTISFIYLLKNKSQIQG